MNRGEAIYKISLKILAELTTDEREAILMAIYSENDEYENITDVFDAAYNKEILECFIGGFAGVTNSYLEKKVFSIDNVYTKIIDHEDYSLLECYCCGYKTVGERGHYEICPLCNWEDDGNADLEKYSPVNRSNLSDAKKEFLSAFNSEDLPIFQDEDILIKYHKEGIVI